MQVFISYAHTPADTELARYLAARLRDAGIDAWLDEASLTGGSRLQADIERAIAASNAGVFLVSPSWLGSEWTAFELEQFRKLDPEVVRRVPVFRAAPERMVIPPALTAMTGVVWQTDDADNDARFWQVHCAVTGREPGPVEEWSLRGRTITASAAAIPPPRRSKPFASGRPSLRCNRAVQWKTVDDLATDGSHEIILVPGVVGQAHEHFLERVQLLLRMDPPRSVVIVDWPTRPRSRDEFREALARAINVTPKSLGRELGLRLARTNIVLIHPCLRARFVDQPLVDYYALWLPELLDECQAQMNLKCLQPVEWPREAGLTAHLLTWMRLRGQDPDEGRPEAEQLMIRMRTGAKAVLPAIRLHELNDITDADLDEFCDVMKLTDAQKAWLLQRMKMQNPKTPREVFQAIDDYLPDARSVT